MRSISFEKVLLATGLGLTMLVPASATNILSNATILAPTTSHLTASTPGPSTFVTVTASAIPALAILSEDQNQTPWTNCSLRATAIGSAYEIQGQNWDMEKLGGEGKGLYDNLHPCSKPLPVAFWKWWWKGDDRSAEGYWVSTGSFASRVNYDCVEKAIVAAGGPEHPKCV